MGKAARQVALLPEERIIVSDLFRKLANNMRYSVANNIRYLTSQATLKTKQLLQQIKILLKKKV